MSERQHLDLAGITSVEVAAFNGDVTVETGTDSPQLEATVGGAAMYEVERLGTLLYIAGKKRGTVYTGSSVGFHVLLPAGLALKLGNINGAIRVKGRVRSLDASTHSGSIEAEGTGVGELRLRTSDGRISARGADGRVEITTANGNIFLADATVTAKLTTLNGSVQVDGVVGALTLATTHGSIAVANSTGQMQLTTSSGDLTMQNVTFTPGTKNVARTGSGAVMVTGLRTQGGMTIDATTATMPIEVDLPEFLLRNRYGKLKAELPGAKPARLTITTMGRVRITH